MANISSIIKAWLNDVRFWIILFFLLRLYGITNPPLEVAHNWRQTTVTMVARNFLETDSDIFYPRVDFAGDKTGITGMEFPLLNYLIYLVSLVFGYEHWYGRLINLIVSSLGIWFFYRLVKKYFSPTLAFNSAFLLIFSAWFTYSRKTMPDTFSVSLMFMGIYYGSNYLDQKANPRNLFLYVLFFLAGALSKLPAAYLLIAFVPILYNTSVSFKAKSVFCLITLPALLLVSAYYFIWVPYLTEHFGFSHFFMGKSMLQGFKEVINEAGASLEKFYLDALQIIGFVLFIAGLVLAFLNKNKTLLWLFFTCFAVYLVVVFKAGQTFSRHSYYIIPFAPVMALLAGYALNEIKHRKIAAIILAAVMLEGVLNKYHDFFIKNENFAIMQLEPVLDSLGTKTDRIAINSGDVPTPMYFAHRKGWIATNNQLKDPVAQAVMKEQGLTFIVILKKTFGSETTLNCRKVFDSEHFAIYTP